MALPHPCIMRGFPRIPIKAQILRASTIKGSNRHSNYSSHYPLDSFFITTGKFAENAFGDAFMPSSLQVLRSNVVQ